VSLRRSLRTFGGSAYSERRCCLLMIVCLLPWCDIVGVGALLAIDWLYGRGVLFYDGGVVLKVEQNYFEVVFRT
jgi:hypothetical protein